MVAADSHYFAIRQQALIEHQNRIAAPFNGTHCHCNLTRRQVVPASSQNTTVSSRKPKAAFEPSIDGKVIAMRFGPVHQATGPDQAGT
jgi:hypothetical protein